MKKNKYILKLNYYIIFRIEDIMPKNTKGGKNTKKQGNKNFKKINIVDVLCEENQLYATILKKLGGDRYSVLCSDNVERIGKPSNKAKRSSNGEYRFDFGTNIVVSLRECDSKKDKCDILAFANPPESIRNIFKKKSESSDNNNDTLIFGNCDDNLNDEEIDENDFDDL
jgi:translation initiation factor IF-1